MGKEFDEAPKPETGSGALPESDYVAPGLWRWMLDEPAEDLSAYMITSIAELRESEERDRRRQKERYRQAVEDAERAVGNRPPDWGCLTETHQHCKLCPFRRQFRIRITDCVRHPFQALKTIYRKRKARSKFQKKIIAGLEALEKSEGVPFQE